MPASREPALATPGSKQLPVADFLQNRRLHWLLLGLSTCAGAYLRLSHLGAKSLWLDEAITLQLARMPWKGFAASWWYGDAAFQSLYYLLMRLWSPGPCSEAWIRLPSAIFGTAAIPLIYLVARKLTDSAAALAASALLAFSVTDVYYSQEARSYTLAIMFVLLSYYFFLQAIETDSRRYWLLWAVSSILAVYSHDFAALVLPAQVCSLLTDNRPIPWRRILSYGLLISVVVAPALTLAFRVPAGRLQYSWMPKASPREFFQLALFLGGTHLRFILVLLLWCVGLFTIIRTRQNARDSGTYWRGMLVVLWFLLPIALLAVVSIVHPVFVQRYMIFSLPAALLLAAIGTVPFRRGHIGLLLVVVLCVSSAIATVKLYREPREDWRAASNLILSVAGPRDVVLFAPDYLSLPFNYYQERSTPPRSPLRVISTHQRHSGETEDSEPIPNIEPSETPNIWLVVSGEHTASEALQAVQPALSAQLRARYSSPQISHFKDITVLRFIAKQP